MSEKDSLSQRVRDVLLYDVYGGLLTEKQREACDMILMEDLSLAEAAEKLKVSRQGVHDLITRARENMEDSEKSLGLLARQAKMEELQELLDENKERLPDDFYKSFTKLLEA